MKIDAEFLRSPLGQCVVIGIVLVIGGFAVRGQHRTLAPLPTTRPAIPTLLPKTFSRDGVRITPRSAPANSPLSVATAAPAATAAPLKPIVLPLTLFVAERVPAPIAKGDAKRSAPYGRLIPCETVTALESNHLETPVIGLVTEDVWHDGNLIVPAGAEVHGRAALDRTRERIAVQGSWHIVWRTPQPNHGTEVTIEGLALDREFDADGHRWGEHDGSAGLRGQVIRTDNDRELKLFAATFLATATSALQDTRSATGLLGAVALPAATARDATLAGTGAVLREYAQAIRESIARDGFYLRVPAGKSFYLYITQSLDVPAAQRGGSLKSKESS